MGHVLLDKLENSKIRLNIINSFMHFVDAIFFTCTTSNLAFIIQNIKYNVLSLNNYGYYLAFTQHESMTKANAYYIHMFNVLGLRNLGLSLEVGAKILHSYIILRLNIHVRRC